MEVRVPDYDKLPAPEIEEIAEIPVLRGQSLQGLSEKVGRPPINWGRILRPLFTLALLGGLSVGGVYYSSQNFEKNFQEHLRQRREREQRKLQALDEAPARPEPDSASVFEQTMLKKCVTDTDFCHLTASDFVRKGEFEHAALYFKTSCDAGGGINCAGLAELVLRGRGVPRSVPQAVELLTRACDLKVGDSCARLGEMYMNGQDVERSFPLSKPFLEKACALKNADACRELGEFQDRQAKAARTFEENRNNGAIFYQAAPEKK